MELPLIRVPKAFHIGTLDPSDLGRNSGDSSLEGKCLSVSVCPHAWYAIAKLGGYPLYEITKDDGEFVDMHAAVDDGLLPRAIEWAVAGGLVTVETRYRCWTWDDELESWTSFVLMTRQEAEEEIEAALGDCAAEAEGPGGRPAVEEVQCPVGTGMLAAVTGRRVRPDEDATDDVLLAWCMENSSADGVWWRERHDPAVLSAPRGAVFPHRVPSWSAREINPASVDDGDELDAFEERLGSAQPRTKA